MSRGFAEIAFTPSVRAVQTAQGSRNMLARWDQLPPEGDLIRTKEQSFIEARDGFYQATVNSEGWPYIQYRGGPAGFLKILDHKTLGFADFRGNVQYVSVGNIMDDERVSLFLMDYANRRRLKIFARAEIVQLNENPELMEKLVIKDYKAKVERAILFHIESLSWNCPQHITPRYTQNEIDVLIAENPPL